MSDFDAALDRNDQLTATLMTAGYMSTLLYSIPLIVAVSLVYAASRYEAPPVILNHALRMGAMIVVLMGVIYAALAAVTLWVV